MKRYLLPGLVALAVVVWIVWANRSASDSAPVARRIAISIPSADHGWTAGVVYWAQRAKEDIKKTHPDVEVILSTAASAEAQLAGGMEAEKM